MGDRSLGRRQVGFGVAVGGVLLGHRLTYLLAVPHRTGAVLRETGHGYLPSLNDLGTVVAVAALAAVFLDRLVDPDRDRPGSIGLAARFVGFQVGVFLAMETAERAVAGQPLAGVLDHGIIPIGVVVQTGVALVAAAAIRWLVAAADTARSMRAATPIPQVRRPVAALVPVYVPPRLHPALASVGLRGPPSSRG
jgi:hypothetical protein